MPFAWVEYYRLALDLSGQEVSPVHDEAKYRAAISRAYYAALHEARCFLRDKDFRRDFPQNKQLHKFIIDDFKEHPDKQRKAIATTLDRLRVQRSKADYHDNFGDLEKQTHRCLVWADSILSSLKEL